MVDQGGTNSPLIFQMRDGGNPSSAGPSIWHVDDPSFTDCTNIDGDNTIVKGNVVVRP